MDEVTPEEPSLEDVSVPAASLDAQPQLGDQIAAEQMPPLPTGPVQLSHQALIAVLQIELIVGVFQTAAGQLDMLGARKCLPAFETHVRKLLQLKAMVMAEGQEEARAVKLAEPSEVARIGRAR